jgi:hypothetical protein
VTISGIPEAKPPVTDGSVAAARRALLDGTTLGAP